MRKSVMAFAVLASLLPLFHSDSAVAQEKHMQLLAPDTGWFLGQGNLYWTNDNGAHWTDITPRMSLPRERVADVQFKDAHEGWVLLSTDENNGPEATFEVASTTNSGGSWAISPVGVPATGSPKRAPLPGEGFMFFLDSMHGWLNLDLEGSQNFSPALLLATEDGGSTWTRKASPGRGAVRFTTANDGWVAGGPGGQHLYSTRDGGRRWQEISLKDPPQVGGGTGGLYSAPTFSDRKHGLLSVTVSSATAMVLFTTADGGRSWRPSRIIKDPAIGRYGIPVPSTVTDSAWRVAKGDQSSITLIKAQLGSGSSGVETRTAAVQKGPSPASVLDISFTTASQGWVLTDRLYATADDGHAWTDITPWPAPKTQTVPVPSGTPQTSEASEPAANLVQAPGSGGGGGGYHTSVHMGFDTCAAPTVSQMQTWWSYSPYHDMGIYIGGVNRACSQSNLNSSWIRKVNNQGWGLMPLWVGPQAPCTTFANRFSSTPAVAASQGTQQADQAATAASSLGLSGSVIFYDLENYDSTLCGAAANAFVSAWVNELHLNGYVAGVYGSVSDAGGWWGLTPNPDEVWIARYDRRATTWNLGHDLSSGDVILDSQWTDNQRAHQYVGNTTQTWGGVTLLIDVDIEAFAVAGGEGVKSFTNWAFTTVDWPPYVGNTLGSGSWANGVNDAGADQTSSIGDLIVGQSNSSHYGYLYTNGSFSTVGCQGSDATPASAINNLAQITTGDRPPGSAYIYSGGTCTAFSYPGATQTSALGINDAGQVVGLYVDSNGEHGFFYNWGGDSSFESFDYPGATATWFTGINGQGQILGTYRDSQGKNHGFIWNHAADGSTVPLDYPGATNTEVSGINANTQVVRWTPGNKTHIFLYADGSFSIFPADPNATSYRNCPTCTTAKGINNYGRVVGEWAVAGIGSTHGFWAVPSP